MVELYRCFTATKVKNNGLLSDIPVQYGQCKKIQILVKKFATPFCDFIVFRIPLGKFPSSARETYFSLCLSLTHVGSLRRRRRLQEYFCGRFRVDESFFRSEYPGFPEQC